MMKKERNFLEKISEAKFMNKLALPLLLELQAIKFFVKFAPTYKSLTDRLTWNPILRKLKSSWP